MTQIVVIVAIAQNGIIGRKNDIPWRLGEDFARFKSLTMGFPCIMGDVTYESLPPNSRPLPGRENVILTFDQKYHPPGTTVFYSFDDAIEYVQQKKVEKAFIIGGASVYKQGMKVADRFELTRIHHDIDGDIYYPEINWEQWELINQEDKQGIDKVSGKSFSFSYLTYNRKQ